MFLDYLSMNRRCDTVVSNYRNRTSSAQVLTPPSSAPRMLQSLSECRDIIGKMIVYEPSKRYTIPKLRAHSWMQKAPQQVRVVNFGTLKSLLSKNRNARSII